MQRCGHMRGTPLHHACRSKDAHAGGTAVAIIQALLRAGADVSASNDGGYTPLHDARSGAVVKALIAAGADPHARSRTGQTPLLHMAYYGGVDTDAFTALVDSGANVNATNLVGDTALRSAAHWGKERVVSTLLQCGADPHSVDGTGATPLDTTLVVVLRFPQRALLEERDGSSGADFRATLTALMRAEAWWRRRHAVAAYYGT